VIALAGVLNGEHFGARSGVGDVSRGRGSVSRHGDVAALVRVIDVEASVRGVRGIERHAEQPLLAARLDDPGDVEERRREERAVLVHANTTRLLNDEQSRIVR
jgi:hypothetical protein